MDEHNNEDLIDSKLEEVEQTAIEEETKVDEKEVKNENENENEKVKEKVKTKKNVNWEKMRKFAFNFAVIVSLFLIAASVTPKEFQNDTFYNIKVGEWIYNNGISDLTEDQHSWLDLPYKFPHWLYDLCIFLVYNTFGYDGIYVSTMIIYGLIGTIAYIYTKNKSNNNVISAIVAVFVVYMLDPYMAARAQSVTFVLFMLEVLCIEKYMDTHKIRYLIPLIIIPILITNLHCAVFPFYFVLFLPYLAEYLIATVVDWDLDRKLWLLLNKFYLKLCKKEKEEAVLDRIEKIKFNTKELRRKKEALRENPYKIKVVKDHAMLLLIIVMLIATLTGFLNPAGPGAYTYLYKTLQGNTTDSINEHLPVTITESEEFLLAIVVALAILLFTDTKIRLPDLFMAAGLTYLALDSRRQISMFILFCLPIMGKLIAYIFKKYDQDKLTNWIYRFSSDVFGVVIILSIATIASLKEIKPTLEEAYIDPSSYPVEICEWIKENLDVENLKLYNEYNYGSYLLLNDIPVFIDSRCDLYTPEFNVGYKGLDGRDIFSDAINIANSSNIDYEEKFEEYGVNYVLTYADSMLASRLKNDSNYKDIKNDNTFILFERKTANVSK